MYKLVGSPLTRAFRVLWALEEMGLDYEIDPASPRSDGIMALNPSGKVPALMDGDVAIVDTSAIMNYLADKHDQLTFPSGTIERGQQDSWLHYALDDMDGICWTAAKHSFVFPEEKRVSGVKESCAWDWDRSMKVFETRLGDNTYLMGNKFTVPDIVAAHTAGWAKNSGFDWPSGKVTQYFERVRNRPAFLKSWEIRGQY